MGLDVGGLHGASPDATVPGQGLEDAQPDTLPASPVEAVVDGRVGAVLGWTVSPTRTDIEHVDDAQDDLSIINPSLTPTATR